MTDLAALKALRDRVAACGEEDRALDSAICVVLHYPPLTEDDTALRITMDSDEDGAITYYAANRRTHKGHAPRLTESLDAALSLVEAKLPGWEWGLRNHDPEPGALAYVNNGGPIGKGKHFNCRAVTPALAILGALLSALIAQAEAEGGT